MEEHKKGSNCGKRKLHEASCCPHHRIYSARRMNEQTHILFLQRCTAPADPPSDLFPPWAVPSSIMQWCQPNGACILGRAPQAYHVCPVPTLRTSDDLGSHFIVGSGQLDRRPLQPLHRLPGKLGRGHRCHLPHGVRGRYILLGG